MKEIEATFCFASRYLDKSRKYFKAIEHGFPIGAAYYFWNMHYQFKHDYDADLASSFIKGNVGEIEAISSYEYSTASPTFFRYYIDIYGYITVKKLVNQKKSLYRRFFNGHYIEFITLHDDFLLDNVNKYERLHALSLDARKVVVEPYMTLSELKNRIDQIEGYLFHNENSTSERHLIDLINEYRRISQLEKD